LPSELTLIDQSAFWFSGLTTLSIPANVTTIGDYAFSHTSALSDVDFEGPNSSLAYVGVGAFTFSTSLASISLPMSVYYIGSNAFYGCSSLERLTIETTTIDAVIQSQIHSFDELHEDFLIYMNQIGYTVLDFFETYSN